jgi:hypothetical protein
MSLWPSVAAATSMRSAPTSCYRDRRAFRSHCIHWSKEPRGDHLWFEPLAAVANPDLDPASANVYRLPLSEPQAPGTHTMAMLTQPRRERVTKGG